MTTLFSVRPMCGFIRNNFLPQENISLRIQPIQSSLSLLPPSKVAILLGINTCIARVRACNEHTIGILKAKFKSLRELPLRVGKESYDRDMRQTQDWIVACAILHNFLIGERTTWSREDSQLRHAPGYGHYDEISMQPDPCHQRVGEQFRQDRKAGALEAGRARRGIISRSRTATMF